MAINTAKKPATKDWDPAEIICALRLKGITLSALAKAYGLSSSSTLSHTFNRSYPLNEQRIADELDIHPMEIWPSRYNKDGSIKPRGFRGVQFNATIVARNSKKAAADSRMKRLG